MNSTTIRRAAERSLVAAGLLALVPAWIWADGAPVRVALAPGETWRQALAISNAGPEAMTVTNVVSSCECLRVTAPSDSIEPGGSGVLQVELTPAAIGELDYEIVAQTTIGEREWILSVEVAAVAPSRLADAYTDLAALRKRWTRGESYTLVDVRSPEEYEAAHIPDSLNIARAAVKSKAFLRGSPVVLVDGGWGDPALEDEWLRLRAAGFADVSILHGGVNVWRAAGGALAGREVGIAPVDVMGGHEVLASRGYQDWVIVAVDEDEDPRLDRQLPGSVRIPFVQTNGAAFVRDVGLRLEKTGPTARLLVLTRDGQGYEAIDDALRGRVAAPVFYLQHGLLGLSRAADVQTLAAGGGTSHRVSGPSRSQGLDGGTPCGTCPGGRRR